MKASLIAVAISCAFLTACTTAPKPKTVSHDPNELPSGTMEPVAGSGASAGSYSWPTDIQSTPMPATMK
ncbi:hypothetical protein MHD_08745 [Mannheimia granulomatis]|uniref:Outer membrane antigenic lipoprotein B n=1 Tax=Mannheimia granulomatis TaxID=85402 RepID=A0A011MFT3_9PAST|nr:hypothetical protein [Mannheimia granulomatis]EXI61356.1 hypothetical protein AK33_10410 [Mannheimia granulomatis]RGE47579.1 hypothetical protein MHD_08745 [Mannheimia granulomatis]